MSELRWNPLIKDWVMIASNRQDRPQMPKDWCPFCPGSGKVPDDYDVYKYDNDFPVLTLNPSEPHNTASKFYKTRKAYGKCEVILYSPNHKATLPELQLDQIKKLVDLWAHRFEDLMKDQQIKYIFIFENRGEIVGVTMPHPHGQIYAYPFIPKRIQLELDSSIEYYQTNGNCLFCDIIKEEVNSGKRVIFENEDFIVFLPFFTEYPYGVYIGSKNHKPNLLQFNEAERMNLARVIKETAGTFDSLFDYQFPYMMCIHQEPVNSGDLSKYCHFHIEFFPPMRSRNMQKFNASSETGAWAHANPTIPEEKAEELRKAYKKYIQRHV
ncbi:MAG TPA: galactose-1-phosphate uridylyltransferase [Clostridiaceae bacterium]|nr:galactose-1-phosphate uridylyltransferase [Clostridiaceae bacterium]